MEMSVSFTGEDEKPSQDEYSECDSVLGKVYLPKDGVQIDEPVCIRYERHPWIETFEFDGIRPERPVREGFGVKSIQGFLISLNSVYSEAGKDFEAYTAEGKSDLTDFFVNVADRMISESATNPVQFRRFCGFIENMWRIGNESAYDLAMESLIPQIMACEPAWNTLLGNITDEFRAAINDMINDHSSEK